MANNIFYGLNIANNTLKAQTSVLNLTAHNIANANTPGYSRQQVQLASIDSGLGQGQALIGNVNVGGGVLARDVFRSRFALYDEIYREENQNLNYNIKIEEFMNQVEILFDEPSDRGLGGIMTDFFNGWLDVANSPQNMAARQSLYSVATEMTERLHRIYNSIVNMREDIDVEVSSMPDDINEISAEIANLNDSIRIVESQGVRANDLRDKRDLLIDNLSEYANVRSVEQSDGTVTVLVGSIVVVEHDSYVTLSTSTEVSDQSGLKKTKIVTPDGTEFIPKEGKMGALLNIRDTVLVNILGDLNTFTENIVNTINFDHAIGYGLDGGTGYDFFDPDFTKAYNIKVSEDVRDVSHIAVSADSSKGDNTNALAIFELRDQRVIDNRYSIKEYYNSMIAELGVLAKEAKSARMNEELLVSQIDNARESVKGVNIDEELVHMIETQRIYQSAARVITVVDSLIEEIVNLV